MRFEPRGLGKIPAVRSGSALMRQEGNNLVAALHERASTDTFGCDYMKFREVIRKIEDDGWVLVTQRGSHRQYETPHEAR